MTGTKAFAVYFGIQLVGQLFAWFIASAYGFPFGTEQYGEIAAVALLLTGSFGFLAVIGPSL